MRNVENNRKWQREYRDKNREKLRASSRDRYAANPQRRVKQVAAAKAWRKANPEKFSAQRLFSLYGMTQQQWDQLFAYQGNKCAVCPRTEPGKRDWHTDHCHETGKVRGILCQQCNTALGLLKDNSTTLRRAAAYIEEHNAKCNGK